MFNNLLLDDYMVSQLRVAVKEKIEIFCFFLKFIVVDGESGL